MSFHLLDIVLNCLFYSQSMFLLVHALFIRFKVLQGGY